MKSREDVVKVIFISALFMVSAGLFSSGPASKLDPYWSGGEGTSDVSIDHSLWQGVLDDYLQKQASGANLFDYGGLKEADDGRLDSYLEALSSIDPRTLPADTEMAYWINMYNAVTVKVVAASYPVESITDIGGGFFSKGPWDDDVIEVTGRKLTLNDIEHRILRPIFDDYRIHFAVNCASIGCPNLSPTAFTAGNLEQQLTTLTNAYLADPRGIEFDDSKLYLSKLFQWYRDDFGDSEQAAIETLAIHVEEDLAAKLTQFSGSIDYRYDWSLNDI